MSPGGRADAARLRRVIAEIEAKAGVSLASEGRAAQRASFSRAFNSALGGGLAEDGLHEIAPATPADGPAAMAFALALAGRFLDRRPRFESLGAPDRRELRQPRSGRALRAGPSRPRAPASPAGVRLRPRRSLRLLGDGGGAEMRRSRRGGGRDLELEALRSPGLPPPPDGRAKRRDAGADRTGERLRPGGCAVHRRHDPLRDRRCAEREAPGGGRAGSPWAVRLHGAAGQGARDCRRDR